MGVKSKPSREQAFVEQLLSPTDNPREITLRDGIAQVYGTHIIYEDAARRARLRSDDRVAFEQLGIILQPKQMQFAAIAFTSDRDDGPNEVGMGGARGGGKSLVLFALAVIYCLRYPGLKVLFLRKTGKAAREQLSDLALKVLKFVPNSELKADHIDFANGSRLLIGGFKDDRQALSYQGVEYDLLILEEVTQLTEHTYTTLRLSERSSKVFNGRRWRPRTYTSTNPLGIGHAFYKKRFVDNERKRAKDEPFNPLRRFVFATVDDNAFVNPEYVNNLDELSGVEYRAYRLGDWDVSAGAYFDKWNHDLHIIAPIDDLSWMRDVWCSMDYGFNHWNIVLLHARDGDGTTYTVDELAHRKRQPSEIAPDIRAWLARYDLTPRKLGIFLVGTDAFAQTGTAQYTLADQYSRLGITLMRAETEPGSRISGAHLIAKLLGDPERQIAPTWYITQRCPRLIETMPYLERNPNQAEDVLKKDADDQGRGGDDPYDALRYGLYRPHMSIIS